MSDQDTGAPAAGGSAAEPEPFMQRLLDNIWLLLAIGLTMPTVLYIFWGLWDIIQIPAAT
ncbi:MAG: hypothetical protein V3R66_03170 [Rhodospirillales bacterium]